MTKTSKLIKICGITTEGTCWAINKAQPDYVGFVIYPPSPRAITVSQAAELKKIIIPSIKCVALMVNPTDSDVDACLNILNPDIIQCHGDETPQRASEIKAISKKPVWKALGIGTQDDLAKALDFEDTDALIVDAKVKGVYGGTGQQISPKLLREIKVSNPWLLAGGLTPENVATTIEQLKPDGVDVSSGVESAPGQKDPEKIINFVTNARKAFSKGKSYALKHT